MLDERGQFSGALGMVTDITQRKLAEAELRRSRDQLREEVIDSFIYLMRLAAILETDLERELFKKLQINQERYRRLERN